MKTVILAAGFGTRFQKTPLHHPKALLKLGGKTMLDHLMEKLDRFPVIEQIAIVCNGLFYPQLMEWSKEARYKKSFHILNNGIYEPEKKNGVLKDLKLGIDSFRGAPDHFLVFYAEQYSDFPIGYFLLPCLGHYEAGFVGLCGIASESAGKGRGLLRMDSCGKIVGLDENHKDFRTVMSGMGMYYFPAAYQSRIDEYLKDAKKDPDSMEEFIHWLSKKETIYGVDFDGVWFDMSTRRSYEDAKKYVESERETLAEEESIPLSGKI